MVDHPVTVAEQQHTWVSARAVAWLIDDAPVPAELFPELLIIAGRSDQHGRGSYQSISTIAEKTGRSEAQTQRNVGRLRELGLILPGDQRLVAHLPAGCRPVVYDLPLSLKGPKPRKESRNPSGKKAPTPRMDARGSTDAGGTANGSKVGQTPLAETPRMDATPSMDATPPPGMDARSTPRMDAGQENPFEKPLEQLHLVADAGAPPARARRRAAEPPRDDVDRICNHLVDKIVANGSKRPTVTNKWREQARLLIDADGRDPDKIVAVIDWCQGDDFWRGNILSMEKLRKQYDTLRLRALAEWKESRGGKANGKPGPLDVNALWGRESDAPAAAEEDWGAWR